MNERGMINVNDFEGASSSRSNVDVALCGALTMGSHQHMLSLPWEVSPTLKRVFDGEVTPWLNPCKIPRGLPTVTSLDPRPPASTAIQKVQAVKAKCYQDASASPQPERSVVLLRWVEIMMIRPEASTVGKQMLEMSVEASSITPLQVMSDTLRGKSISTLKIRISSLALYCKWMNQAHGDEIPFPLIEVRVYEYLNHLRTHCCSASRGSTFMSTIAFCADVLRLEGAWDCINSVRARGAALEMYLTKRPMRQAPPLSPVMVAVLEWACFCEADPHTRAVAGFCLCCLFGRMRVSDLGRLVHLSTEGKYAEGSLMRVKTARSKEKQCTFLPVIFPTSGFMGLNWVGAFITTRRQMGLKDIPTLESGADDRSFVLLPSRATAHLDTCSRITSSEVTDTMKVILGKVFPSDVVCKLTSHSLKTTVLTYLSKSGCDYTYSELLGYHLTQHFSAINYQRDALAAPIRYMMDILSKIQEGSFVPMTSRDEMYVMVDPVPVDVQLQRCLGKELDELTEIFMSVAMADIADGKGPEDLQEMWNLLCREPVAFNVNPNFLFRGKSGDDAYIVTDAEESDEESSNESSDSDSSSAESGVAVAARMWPGERAPSAKGLSSSLHRHTRTRMLHMGHVDDSSKTACGRMLGSTFVNFLGDPDKAWPHCKKCWGTLDP